MQGLCPTQITPATVPKVQVNLKGRETRQTTSFSPIRITAVPMKLALNSTFRDKLTDPDGPLMQVIEYLENTLRVRPIQGSLTIPPSCDASTHMGLTKENALSYIPQQHVVLLMFPVSTLEQERCALVPIVPRAVRQAQMELELTILTFYSFLE